ncbi:MAG: hypothetical protein H7145_08795, partial [Akkermansiaceae bacterium]|nr:hypothetical protein [Armatimonadota bacterium]
GLPNPDVPGLYVFFDCDLITPDGTVLPKGTNFASAFNVAGSDDTPGPGMTLWLGWHVLESIPAGIDNVTITVAFVDAANRIGFDQIKVRVDGTKGISAQALTPAVATFPGISGVEDPLGPEVSMIAPRVPTAIAVGPTAGLTANNGSLKFIQVTAVDRSGAGIAVNETGIRTGNTLPFGLIFDPSQIPNPATNGGVAGPNRNYPGLDVSFDVPLRQPNGNVVAAGINLAPLFDVVGSEIDAITGAVRVTADWVVGGSLVVPTGKTTVTITTRVTDNSGKAGVTKSVLPVSAFTSGQDMSLNP